MGDFHITKIDWSITCILLNHTFVDTKLLLFYLRVGLKQIVPKATHDLNYTDLVFVSHNNLMLNFNVKITFSIYYNDHSSFKFNLTFVSSFSNVSYPNPCLKNFQAPGNFNFDKTDHAGLADDLMHTD